MRKLSQNLDTSLGCFYPMSSMGFKIDMESSSWFQYNEPYKIPEFIQCCYSDMGMVLPCSPYFKIIHPVVSQSFTLLDSSLLSVIRSSSCHLEFRSDSFLLPLMFTFPATDFIEVLTQEKLSPSNLSVLSQRCPASFTCQPGREEIIMVLLLRESSVFAGEFT